MRMGALACIILGTGCLIAGLLHRFDIAILVTAGSVGLFWALTLAFNGPASFHSVFFVLMALFSGFVAGFGAQLPFAAAALSFSLCAWDLCMTAPRLSCYPARARRRFVPGYLIRSIAWAAMGFLLVVLSHAPRSESHSIYLLIGLAMLTLFVILFLLWRIRKTFTGESDPSQQEDG